MIWFGFIWFGLVWFDLICLGVESHLGPHADGGGRDDEDQVHGYRGVHVQHRVHQGARLEGVY